MPTDDLIQIRRKDADDPILRHAERVPGLEGLSPMEPPDAYSPPGEDQGVPREELHPFLQGLWDEHVTFVAELEAFEGLLGRMRAEGIDRGSNEGLRRFFEAIDERVVPHNRLEEKRLFPLLAQRLIERGEAGTGAEPTTAVDVLERDHTNLLQLAAVVLNLFALGSRLPDERSRLLTFDAALEQGKALIELLRLHIFREDRIVFSLAHRLLTGDELDRMKG